MLIDTEFSDLKEEYNFLMLDYSYIDDYFLLC